MPESLLLLTLMVHVNMHKYFRTNRGTKTCLTQGNMHIQAFNFLKHIQAFTFLKLAFSLT